MNKILYSRNKFAALASFVLFYAVETWAQMPSVHVPQTDRETPEPVQDDTWWYATLFLLFIGLAGAVYW